MSRSFRLWELSLVLPALGLLGILAFGPHLQHGGFYLDDWSNGARALNPPGAFDAGKALSSFAEFTLYRPVLVLYVPLLYLVFGTHMHYHLAWAVLLAVFASVMFYGVLRTLGVPWIHAALLAALALLFPWSDSTRLWATGDQVTLSVFFFSAGLLVALRGLSRPIWPRHACAAAFYLASILTYEITLPLIVCAGILYRVKVGWGAARGRWLVDLGVAVVGGVWVAVNTPRVSSGLAASFDHLRQIGSAGGTMIGRAGFALGSQQTTIVLCALALVLGAGVASLLAFPGRFASRPGWGLRNWLCMALGGVVVAALGWAMLIPADAYYTPTIYGEVNRVNGLAAFGMILLVYGAFGTAATLLGQVRPRVGWIPLGVTAGLAVALLASYAHVLRRHIAIWDSAFNTETAILGEIKAQLPVLPRRTRLFISSSPANETLGVPIFTAWWDLNGAIRLEYDDSTLSARPMVQGLRLVCGDHSLALRGSTSDPRPVVPYGSATFLDLQTRGIAVPTNRDQCLRVAQSSVPGSLYLSTSY